MSVQAKIYPAKVVANAGFKHLVALGGPHFIKQAPTAWPIAPILIRMLLFCFVLCCSCCRVEIGNVKMEIAETRKRERFWRHFRERGDLLADMNFTVIMSYNMPTLGPVIGRHQWVGVSILVGVLVLYVLAKLQYITSSEVIVWGGWKKSLLIVMHFGKRRIFFIMRGSSGWQGAMTGPSVGMVFTTCYYTVHSI